LSALGLSVLDCHQTYSTESFARTLRTLTHSAGAICCIKYGLNINSWDLAERLRKEKSVLIVPGDHFGMDGYIRIGTGPPKDHLLAGLDRVDELLRELKAGRKK